MTNHNSLPTLHKSQVTRWLITGSDVTIKSAVRRQRPSKVTTFICFQLNSKNKNWKESIESESLHSSIIRSEVGVLEAGSEVSVPLGLHGSLHLLHHPNRNSERLQLIHPDVWTLPEHTHTQTHTSCPSCLCRSSSQCNDRLYSHCLYLMLNETWRHKLGRRRRLKPCRGGATLHLHHTWLRF